MLLVVDPHSPAAMAPQSKRRLRRSSRISSLTYSPRLLSTVELASDRQKRVTGRRGIPRLRVTTATTPALSDGHASPGCWCRFVRNSSLTFTWEGSAAVWGGKTRSWMMRRSFRFCHYPVDWNYFSANWRIPPPPTRCSAASFCHTMTCQGGLHTRRAIKLPRTTIASN